MLSMRVVPRENRLLAPKNAKKHSSGLFYAHEYAEPCMAHNYFNPKNATQVKLKWLSGLSKREGKMTAERAGVRNRRK